MGCRFCKRQVPDLAGFFPDPTFEKIPNPDPNCEKTRSGSDLSKTVLIPIRPKFDLMNINLYFR